MKIRDILLKQKHNSKPAIIYDGTVTSYAELYNRSSLFGHILEANTAETESNCAIFIHNSTNYAIAYFAIALANKVIVPLNTNAVAAEILAIIKYCEIDTILCDNTSLEYLSSIVTMYSFQTRILNVDTAEVINVNTSAPFSPKSSNCSATNEVAILLHTSGTTSDPKRVMLTHDNLISNVRSNIASLELSYNDVSLIALPMLFGYCNSAQFLTHMYMGATIVIMEGLFSATSFFNIVAQYKVTNFTAVPSILLTLLHYKNYDSEKIKSLRYICFGGGIMPPDILAKLIKQFPSIGFVHTYGQTEAGPRITALLPADSTRKIGSVGKPLPGVQVKLNIENNNDSDYSGEILVYSKSIMLGYYKHPEETSKVIDKSGWLHTGDIAHIDSEGYIYLIGRKKNIIISGGINVYPEEVEAVLLSFDGINEAYVYGMPHKLLGEIPVAEIVPDPGATVNFQELKEYCKAKLSNYKVPHTITLRSSFEKTVTGKIKRTPPPSNML